MKSRLSFRWRFTAGSAIWAIGLLVVATAAASATSHQSPSWRFIAHNAMLIALAFVVAGFVVVRRGLSPFTQLRSKLGSVRDGHATRLEGDYPAEIQPLVDDLNTLLDDRDRRVARALAKAGDLAHGLKTPLAVLAHEAERARAAGHDELAAAIDSQVSRMRRQMDYHLAQARAAASGADPGARCSVRESADGLARTLLRLHASRGLTIDVAVAADHQVRSRREDLDEMLGNLLDNACKWAGARVAIASARDGGRIIITVDDDGPGIEPSMREAVLRRGVKADEAAPGTGFGLAIVRDLAELYSGSVSLTESPLGGLRARLDLPSA